MSDVKEKAFPLKAAAYWSAILVNAMMKKIPNRLNSQFQNGAFLEPRITDEAGQTFDCLYQYHAYLWGKYGKERADKMVDDFKKEVMAVFESIFASETSSGCPCFTTSQVR